MVGCAAVLALGFVTLVIVGLIFAASTQPAHQQQRHTTTQRVSR
ncbi:MAG TPA: hypothetical protein VIW69_15155 [Candidatus Elarobacter sp.]